MLICLIQATQGLCHPLQHDCRS